MQNVQTFQQNGDRAFDGGMQISEIVRNRGLTMSTNNKSSAVPGQTITAGLAEPHSDVTHGKDMIKSSYTSDRRSWLGMTMLLILGFGVCAQIRAAQPTIVTYSSKYFTAATGVINSKDPSFTTLQYYPASELAPWTNIAGGSTDLLFYNSNTGAAALSQVDSAGRMSTSHYYKGGTFGYWTNVVLHKGYYLFYRSDTGEAAVGDFESDGLFHQYSRGVRLSANWSCVTSTPNGLLFYAKDGSAAVADWSFVYSTPPGGGFRVLSQINFATRKLYGPGVLPTSWTHVVNTSNGVLFYRSDTGRLLMTDVKTDGSVVARPGTDITIEKYFTSIASAGNDILLYKMSNGDVGFGQILTVSGGSTTFGGPPLPPGAFALRTIKRTYFVRDWTDIVAVLSPTF
jgi:hypothetical protein